MRLPYPLWLLALAAVGAIALGSVVLDLFVGVGRRPARLQATQAPPAGSPDFLMAVAGVLGAPLRSGGTAVLLQNGEQVFPALLEAIRAARHNINMAVYIWEDGRVSDMVVPALVERAQAGVEVRVLLDGFGSRGLDEATRERMRRAGIRLGVFRPLRFGKLTRFHKRNHRRAIVVDGATAFTGGVAIGDKWLGDARNPDQWRDDMLLVTGPPAASVQSAFADVWAYTTGELLAGEAFFPRASGAASAPEAGGAAGAQSTAPRDEPLVHAALASAPSSEDHPLGLLFVLTIAGARQRLWVTTPYFVPDRAMREALSERARAGVDVRLLLPNERTDAWPVRRAGQAHFEELLAAGVRIWEYQPTMLHSKSMVADGVWSVLGSANLDLRARELDHENVLGIAHAGLAGAVEKAFQADLARAREITLEGWRRRGVVQRAKERACSILAQVY